MKPLYEILMESMNESKGFEGDILQLKKSYVLYTSGDYDMFCDMGKEDIWEELCKYLGNSDGDVVIPRGSIIQLGEHDEYFRGITLWTKKVNFLGLTINADQEEEIMDIAKEIGVEEMDGFTKRYQAITIG